jgi:hypothetical protein
VDCDNPDCCPPDSGDEPTMTWPTCLKRSEPRADGPQFEPTIGQVVADIWQACAEIAPHLQANGWDIEACDIEYVEGRLRDWLDQWHATYPEPGVYVTEGF